MWSDFTRSNQEPNAMTNSKKICNFQLIPKLNANIMSEIERILDNKPSRPPMISTLALRWQSMCPHGSGGGSVEEAGSPKSEGGNSQDQEQTKEVNNKLPFCEIQWSHMRMINRFVAPHDNDAQHQVAKDWHGCDSFSHPRFTFGRDPVRIECTYDHESTRQYLPITKEPISGDSSPVDDDENIHSHGVSRTSRTICISRTSHSWTLVDM